METLQQRGETAQSIIEKLNQVTGVANSGERKMRDSKLVESINLFRFHLYTEEISYEDLREINRSLINLEEKISGFNEEEIKLFQIFIRQLNAALRDYQDWDYFPEKKPFCVEGNPRLSIPSRFIPIGEVNRKAKDLNRWFDKGQTTDRGMRTEGILFETAMRRCGREEVGSIYMR